jgi:hypothetical protein
MQVRTIMAVVTGGKGRHGEGGAASLDVMMFLASHNFFGVSGVVHVGSEQEFSVESIKEKSDFTYTYMYTCNQVYFFHIFEKIND